MVNRSEYSEFVTGKLEGAWWEGSSLLLGTMRGLAGAGCEALNRSSAVASGDNPEVWQ